MIFSVPKFLTCKFQAQKNFLLLFVFLLPEFAKAQLTFGIKSPDLPSEVIFYRKDSLQNDSLPRKKMAPPKKAAILSACLPGLGQAYNHTLVTPYGKHPHSLWKIPVIYAGFGGLAYGFLWNHNYVKDYRDALRLRYDDDPTTIDQFPRYSDNDLVTLKNYYQRYRDLCVIGAAALYTLQILDATVDAHLSTFDVGDNLSMQFAPSVFPTNNGPVTTIGFRLRF
ncbi:hypothetical protein BH09BAC5_BH09BAC5_14520 [soil metagenome]